MPIPPYNTKLEIELYHEHAYHFHNGRICRKGGKYFMPFKVDIIPENLVEEHGKYTYHQTAMKNAEAWMQANEDKIFIEWWGPDSDDLEAIEFVMVRFRNYLPVSWNEEIGELAHVSGIGSSAQQDFVGDQFGQIGRFMQAEEYIPRTAWQRFLARIGKMFTVKRKSYIYEDINHNWDLYQDAIAEEVFEKQKRLKKG